jgi:hypothetical protein
LTTAPAGTFVRLLYGRKTQRAKRRRRLMASLLGADRAGGTRGVRAGFGTTEGFRERSACVRRADNVA